MEYNYNLNSRVKLSIKDKPKNDGISEDYPIDNTEQINQIIDLIDIIHNKKYNLILNVKYFQIPDDGSKYDYEIVKEEEFICETYDDFMKKIAYIFSQERVNDLKYWN